MLREFIDSLAETARELDRTGLRARVAGGYGLGSQRRMCDLTKGNGRAIVPSRSWRMNATVHQRRAVLYISISETG